MVLHYRVDRNIGMSRMLYLSQVKVHYGNARKFILLSNLMLNSMAVPWLVNIAQYL